MIQVDALTLVHGDVLIDKGSVSLQPKEKVAFVGRNGSGKSSLFKLLTGKDTPDGGSISIRKNYLIGCLDQHIVFSQPTLLEEAALGLRPEEKDFLYKAETILFGLGFSEKDMDRSPHEFSGGYQLRLHLAKVLIGEPDCLLLDEPTNYLDIVSIRWFTEFLQEWQGEFILISHDREFLDSVCTHTMGIHRKKLNKVKGGTVQFFEQIMLAEEHHQKALEKSNVQRRHLENFIERFGAKASKATQAASKQKALDRIPVLESLKNLYNLDFEFSLAPFYGKKMLEATGVSFSYDPNATKQLIKNMNLSMGKERVGIIGKNGRGKSTFLRLLAGDLTPLKGEIKRSENLAVGYFGQTHIDRLHPSHTVEEEIKSANPKLSYTQVKAICGLMMFSGDKSLKSNAVLSGGEKSRVLLGKILATPCNFLLLDEPTHHLDMESIEALIDAIEDFDGGVIMVTHSELILKRMKLDKIIICHEDKQEVFLGTYEEFLAKNGWHE